MTSQESTESTQACTEHKRRAARPKIGFLGATKHSVWSEFVAAFEQELRAHGLIDGRDIDIIYEWAEGQERRYKEIAQNFALTTQIIVTAGTAPLKAVTLATSNIQIVVASAGHTGSLPANVTGSLNAQPTLAKERFAKFLEGVDRRDLTPMAAMANLHAPNAMKEMAEVIEAAGDASFPAVQELKIAGLKGQDIVPKINSLASDVKSLYVCTDPLITTHTASINTLAARKGLATMFAFRGHVERGGLMSYGPDFRPMFQRAAVLVHKFLRGEQLPQIVEADIQQFEFVFNRTTATALNLDIRRLEAIADHSVE
jgi:putative ABC transport system substrate-binding protein